MTDVTDNAPEQDEGWDGDEASSPPGFPEFPLNPHNHPFTISMNGQGPMIVVRGNTAEEVKERFKELDDAGVGVVLGQVWNSIKSGAALGQGGAQQVAQMPAQGPSGPPPAPGTGPAYNPQMPPPQPAGSAPAAWQNAGAPPAPPAQQWGGNGNGNAQGNRGPKPRPDNWGMVYKIEVPYQQKDAFKAYREQYKDAFKGKVAYAGGGGYWVHGDVVQSFANYNPVPA